ncbi:histidine triad nucleotide-binding protein [Sphaerotilus sp.]|uniref:histidine triad nucleotide-binding protein n=1 Tax=Sphaerotilus sp. TaxID=2093942 RepID=UPI0034E20899
MSHDPNCLFCRIASGDIPAQKVYEDDELIAFKDIRPAAPVHLLVIPRQHVAGLGDVGVEHEALLGRMLTLAPRLAAEQGATNGFRIVINTGPDGGQEVYHLHLHVMGGPRPWKHG